MPVQPFILNDESRLNSHGFILLNSGGDFSRFKDNPVMLDAHSKDSCLDVIGKWLDLRTEGAILLANPEFDQGDDVAKKIEGKVERGYVRGASLGIYIHDAELREIPTLGHVPIATRWELLEASPVPVPSNAAALRLYASDRKTILASDQISLSIENLIKPSLQMEKINLSAEAAKALGIPRDPEAAELNAAVMELSAKLESEKTARSKAETEKTAAEKTLTDHNVSLATKLVDEAIAAGKITADKKESYVKLATTDYQQAKDVLDSLPEKQNFSAQTTAAKTGKAGEDRESWNYMDWLKKAPADLKAMEQSEPQRFTSLKESYKSKS